MNTEMNKDRKVRRIYRAREKAAAVLSMWSKRRNAHRICKELGISWTLLNGWEKRAIQGMMRGLGGEVAETAPGVLGPRMEKVLAEMTVAAEVKETKQGTAT